MGEIVQIMKYPQNTKNLENLINMHSKVASTEYILKTLLALFNDSWIRHSQSKRKELQEATQNERLFRQMGAGTRKTLNKKQTGDIKVIFL